VSEPVDLRFQNHRAPRGAHEFTPAMMPGDNTARAPRRGAALPRSRIHGFVTADSPVATFVRHFVARAERRALPGRTASFYSNLPSDARRSEARSADTPASSAFASL